MRFFTSVHILLLAYIITALVWWEISLQKQSGRIYAQEVLTLQSQIDSARLPTQYNAQMLLLKKNLDTRTSQYVAEGCTFLIVILIGAVIVYNSFKRTIKLSRQQNNFMLSVTHELKSPIAAVKLNLQTIEKHHLDGNKRQLLLDRSIKEADRLNDLCNKILFTSRIEGGQFAPTYERFDLADIANSAVWEYEVRYMDRFLVDINPGCMILGDKTMLQIVINNLLENAVKYTPPDQTITVSLKKVGLKVVLSVADNGPGIPDREKKKVFQKFYRVGNEESRQAKGTGLGLYLTQKMIGQHKGKISVKDNKPTGAVFEIVLPWAG